MKHNINEAALLLHYGVIGQKWGVRRTPEQLGHIRCLPDIEIHKSVGAKFKNYDILDPQTNQYLHFVEGTKIQDAQVFAGKGGTKPLKPETIEGLVREFGGVPEKWQHCKGKGIIDDEGDEVKAEVHWFQEESVGKHKFKIKKRLE